MVTHCIIESGQLPAERVHVPDAQRPREGLRLGQICHKASVSGCAAFGAALGCFLTAERVCCRVQRVIWQDLENAQIQ